MKRTFLLLALTVGSFLMVNAQSFRDNFTVYESATPRQQPRQQQSESYYSVPEYNVIDPDAYFRSTGPQNVQTTTGVYVKNGYLYNIKLKVGISGVNSNQVIVCSYWDGRIWNNSTHYASSIGYDAPEQIRRACAYEVYLPAFGTVYF